MNKSIYEEFVSLLSFLVFLFFGMLYILLDQLLFERIVILMLIFGISAIYWRIEAFYEEVNSL